MPTGDAIALLCSRVLVVHVMYLTEPVSRVTGTEIGIAAVWVRFGGGAAISYVIGHPAGKIEPRHKMTGGVVASCRSA